MKKTEEVSRMVGVSRRTLQYYDDEGVIRVKRSENNHRLYDQEALNGIWKVIVYKEMGFDLKSIKELLSIPEGEQQEYLRVRMKEIENNIRELKGQKQFILWVLSQGMPVMPEENAGVTYMDRISELRKRRVQDRQNYAEIIGKCRYRLDEAYQQMQRGQLRYALYDAGMVMREIVRLFVQHMTGEDDACEELSANLKICEQEKLFGGMPELMDRLYEVCHICECDGFDLPPEEHIDRAEVRFAIMQIKDLLNFAETKLVSEQY